MSNEALMFKDALMFHAAGHFERAKRRYLKILKINPKSFDVWHHLGQLNCSTGDYKGSIDAFEKALLIDNKFPPLYNSLGRTFLESGQPAKALENFDKAILLQSNYPSAYYNRALALVSLDREIDAINAYQRALFFNPTFFDAKNNLGNLYLKIGRIDEAEKQFNEIITVRPDYALAYLNRSNLQALRGNLNAQISDLEQVLRYDRNNIDAICQLSQCFLSNNETGKAFERIIRAVTIDKDNVKVQKIFGRVLFYLQRYDEAFNCFTYCIIKKYQVSQVLNDRAATLIELGRFEEAQQDLNCALSFDPSSSEIRYNLACIYLRKGIYGEGFSEYRHRKTMDNAVGNRSFSAPLWTGEQNLNGKTILIHEEQGIGDIFQFSRFLLDLISRQADVLFGTRKGLKKILSSIDPQVSFVDPELPNVPFDYHAPLLDLPNALSLKFEDLPAHEKYLDVDPSIVEKWSKRIGVNGFKIAVSWQGGSGLIDVGRSIPFSCFKSIASIPNVRLLPVQKEVDLNALRNHYPDIKLESLGDIDLEDSFVDTAAIMKCCDLVITSDTSTAHLAGAMGLPVWIALKKFPEWRWMDHGDTSPWYSSMRLFRQSNRGDWLGVFNEIRDALNTLLDFKNN